MESNLTHGIRQHMRSVGAARSTDLQAACGASQASVSRALAPLLTAAEVLKVGRGRAQAYVMPRRLRDLALGESVPVCRVDESGRLAHVGGLVPVVGGRYWMDEDNGPARLHGGLPWFLSDMRPQGFLGRGFAQAHPALQLAPNPEHWNDDDVLRALCLAGWDLPGNLVVGAASIDRLQRQGSPVRVTPGDYPALAEAAMHGAAPGSSAGGEQPKFCAVREDGRAVLVKFSPPEGSALAQRWRDLLICEHLALRTLDAAGVPAAASRVCTGAGRVFLEVERFDRTARGRIGMVSLLAYDSEYVGQIDNWALAAGRMAARDLLTPADADRLCLLEAFGCLIGNTDRHYGNVSLLLERGRWRLAPAYDMLPMLYAPVGGELVPRAFDPGTLVPTAQTLRQWPLARRLAHACWQAAARDRQISPDFRALARDHARSLA